MATIDEIFDPAILDRFKNPEVSQYYYIAAEERRRVAIIGLSATEKQSMNGDIARVNEVYRISVNRQLDEAYGKAGLVNLCEIRNK
jgi:hypothetical protein